MSIFRTIKDEDILLYVDYRSGTFKDKSGNYSSQTISNVILDNRNAKFNSTGQVEFGTINIGTSDFSVLSSIKILSGSTLYSTNIDSDDLAIGVFSDTVILSINSSPFNFSSALSKSASERTVIALCFDRDVNVSLYESGLHNSDKDISSQSAYDLNGTLRAGRALSNKSSEQDYLLYVNRVLTATEVALLTAELESIQYPKLVTSKAIAENEAGNPNANELTDGDMEASGTGAYTNATGLSLDKDAIIKHSGTQSIKFVSSGTGQFFYQVAGSTGKLQRYSGWARGDGLGCRPLLRIQTPVTTSIWTGTTSTDWQYFEVEDVPETATILFSSTGVAGAVWWDDILLQEVGKPYYDVRFKTDWGVLANERTISSGFIENTPFEVQNGSFKVVMDTYNGKDVKAIECISSGAFKLGQTLDGTTWELYADTGSGYVKSDGIGIISSQVFTLTAGDKIILSDITGDYGIIRR